MVLNAFLTECTKLAMALRSITQKKKNQITLKRAVVHIKIEILEREIQLCIFWQILIHIALNL